MGDLPFADVKPPENVLFVCKLNPITRDEDLELIFSRFGPIARCVGTLGRRAGHGPCSWGCARKGRVHWGCAHPGAALTGAVLTGDALTAPKSSATSRPETRSATPSSSLKTKRTAKKVCAGPEQAIRAHPPTFPSSTPARLRAHPADRVGALCRPSLPQNGQCPHRRPPHPRRFFAVRVQTADGLAPYVSRLAPRGHCWLAQN